MRLNKDYASMEIWELARLSVDDGDVIIVDDTWQYYFAINGSIPEGKYHSIIDFIENTKTSAGNPAYDVGYTLTPFRDYVKAINSSSLDELNTDQYFLRVRYKKPSDAYRKFSDAMYLAGLPLKFKPSETIGVEEIIRLEYSDENRFGEIKKRVPVDFYFGKTSDEYENNEE